MKPVYLAYVMAISLFGFLAFASPSFAEFQSGYEGGGACFYEHSNFKGRKFCAKTGEQLKKLGKRWNNNFSSLQLDDSVTVYVCSKSNFGGKCRFLRNEISRLGEEWDDKISSAQISLKSNPVRPESTYRPSVDEEKAETASNREETARSSVEDDEPQEPLDTPRRDQQRKYDEEDIADLRTPTPGRRSEARRDRESNDDLEEGAEEEVQQEVCFFEHRKFRGRSMCLTESDTVNELRGRWNDSISSIRSVGDVEIKICEDAGLEGECEKFRGSKRFVGWGWNDKISSFKIRFPRKKQDEDAEDKEKDEVCFFEHKEFEGQSFCIPAGETVKRLRRWDDKISSFIVHGNVKVRICAESYLSGECTTFRRSKRFVGWTWNDEISSLRVDATPADRDR